MVYIQLSLFFGDEHGFFVDLRLCHSLLQQFFMGSFLMQFFLSRDNLKCTRLHRSCLILLSVLIYKDTPYCNCKT